MNLIELNRALALFSQTETIPFYQTFLIIQSIACGAIILDEF